MNKISVIGAGSWGTALADVLSKAQKDVTLYARNPLLAEKIIKQHENPDYLPAIKISPDIKATADLKLAVTGAEIILLVMPAQHLREYLVKILEIKIAKEVPLVICCKGIESASGKLLTAITAEFFPQNPIAVLSGPSFALEAAQGLPCALTLALDNKHRHVALQLAQDLSGKNFRPYLADDIIGVEIGGAVKNVIAIACGVVAGAKLGENAKAAIMTRGLSEISRLGTAMGASEQTFLGLSGMGDLVLTCHSMSSRNFSLGFELGSGRKLADILAGRKGVTEGVASTGAVLKLAEKHGIDMPIAQAVNDLIEKGVPVAQIAQRLLARPLRQEKN